MLIFSSSWFTLECHSMIIQSSVLIKIHIMFAHHFLIIFSPSLCFAFSFCEFQFLNFKFNTFFSFPHMFVYNSQLRMGGVCGWRMERKWSFVCVKSIFFLSYQSVLQTKFFKYLKNRLEKFVGLREFYDQYQSKSSRSLSHIIF